MSSTSSFLSNMAALSSAQSQGVDRETLHKLIVAQLAREPLSLVDLAARLRVGEAVIREAMAYLEKGNLIRLRAVATAGGSEQYELTGYARDALTYFALT